MAHRKIYEYPRELLWHTKSMKWYFENDPNGLHKEMADTLLKIRKEGRNIGDIVQILNDAYCLAVTVATTEEAKYSDIANRLSRLYTDDMAVLCGCVILMSQYNCEEYKDTTDELIENIIGSFSDNESEDSRFRYQLIKQRIIGLRKTDLHTDLSPDAFVDDDQTIQWLIKNMSSLEFETIIGFHRTKKSQLDFLNVIINQFFVEEELAF